MSYCEPSNLNYTSAVKLRKKMGSVPFSLEISFGFKDLCRFNFNDVARF